MLRLENVGKKFYRLKSTNSVWALNQLFRALRGNSELSKRATNEFWAVDNINLEVKKGESVGVIGLNGSGKTTLMKLICKLLIPDTGTVSNQFYTQQMINLGSGFDPSETASENVITELTLRGISPSETLRISRNVFKFAELEEFSDMPVEKFSSGMAARLGFSLCVYSNPELLVIDEALSVGDERFKDKCLAKMQELKNDGVSMLFVSHSMTQISQFCERAIWINDGKIVGDGPTDEIIKAYLDDVYGKETPAPKISPPTDKDRPDCDSSIFVETGFRARDSELGPLLPAKDCISDIWHSLLETQRQVEDGLDFSIGFTLKEKINDLHFSLNIVSETFELITTISSRNFDINKGEVGKHQFNVSIERLGLVPGKYFITLPIHDGAAYLYRNQIAELTIMPPIQMTWGKVVLSHTIALSNFSDDASV